MGFKVPIELDRNCPECKNPIRYNPHGRCPFCRTSIYWDGRKWVKTSG